MNVSRTRELENQHYCHVVAVGACRTARQYLVSLYRTFLKTWPGLGAGVMIFSSGRQAFFI
jgi:hypothetical protein